MSWSKLGERTLVIYGPPGTGKTTRVLDLYASEIEHGTKPERIALVTFSKAAQLEAAGRASNRLGLPPDSLPWIRTLHSTAYQVLGLSRLQVYSAAHHRAFCAQHHYRLTATARGAIDDYHSPPRRTTDDELRAIHEWGIQRDVTLREAWQKGPRVSARWEVVQRYVNVFGQWKSERNIFDFFDMLLRARGLPGPPVDVCFVDEAQDLTPLQISLVYAWFGNCERIYVAGDDDQAIYDWNGADPGWLVGLRDRCDHHEILSKSHRVPEAVRRVANLLIAPNKNRVAKYYQSARAGGALESLMVSQAVTRLADRAQKTGWTCLVLVRNRVHGRAISEELLRAGLPYSSEMPPRSPLDVRGIVKAVRAAQVLLAGGKIAPGALRELLGQFELPKVGYLPPYVMDRAERQVRAVGAVELEAEWGLGAVMDRLREKGPALGLVKASWLTRAYLGRVALKYGELPNPPPIVLTTIHGAKGREADTVVVSSDMTRATWLDWQNDPEPENRVAYVAVTRARRELIVCDPRTPRSYPYSMCVERVLRGDDDDRQRTK